MYKAFQPVSLDEKEAIDHIYFKAWGNAALAGPCQQAGQMLQHYLTYYPAQKCTTVQLNMTEFLTQAGIAHAWMKMDVNYAMGAAEQLVTEANSGAYIVTKQEFCRTVSAETADMAQVISALGKDVVDKYFSMDWWLALGAYRTWMSGQVLVQGNSYTMILQYNLRDYYDFECGSEQEAGLTLDWEMNALHQAGLACNFDIIGAIVFEVKWSRGAKYGTAGFTITPDIVPTTWSGGDACEYWYASMQAVGAVPAGAAYLAGLAFRR